MDERTFTNSPLAQDYLYYVQDQIQKGVPLANITTPDDYYANRVSPGDQQLMQLESTDPRLTAIRRIYALLGQKGTR